MDDNYKHWKNRDLYEQWQKKYAENHIGFRKTDLPKGFLTKFSIAYFVFIFFTFAVVATFFI